MSPTSYQTAPPRGGPTMVLHVAPSDQVEVSGYAFGVPTSVVSLLRAAHRRTDRTDWNVTSMWSAPTLRLESEPSAGAPTCGEVGHLPRTRRAVAAGTVHRPSASGARSVFDTYRRGSDAAPCSTLPVATVDADVGHGRLCRRSFGVVQGVHPRRSRRSTLQVVRIDSDDAVTRDRQRCRTPAPARKRRPRADRRSTTKICADADSPGSSTRSGRPARNRSTSPRTSCTVVLARARQVTVCQSPPPSCTTATSAGAAPRSRDAELAPRVRRRPSCSHAPAASAAGCGSVTAPWGRRHLARSSLHADMSTTSTPAAVVPEALPRRCRAPSSTSGE